MCTMLEESDIREILRTIEYFEFGPGEVVLREGEPGSHFFITHSGQLQVSVAGRVVNTIEAGKAFGGAALLYNCPRGATVTAQDACAVWGANGRRFQAVLKANAQRQFAQYRESLCAFQLFGGLPERIKDRVSEAVFVEAFEEGARVATEGETARCMYFVRSGELREVRGGTLWTDGELTGGEELSTLRADDCFGERALLYSEPWTSTFLAACRCELLCISGRALKEALGEEFSPHLLERSLIMESLRRCPVFKPFSSSQRAAVARGVSLETLQPGDPIDEADGLAIVVYGKVEAQRSGGDCPEMMRTGAWFGAGGDGAAADAGGTVEAQVGGDCEEMMRTGAWFGLGRLGDGAAEEDHAGASVRSRVAAGPNGCRLAFVRREAIEGAQKLILLKKVHVFRHLSQQQTQTLVDSFVEQTYSKGDYVVTQGERGTTFFVISTGEVRIMIGDRLVRTLASNDYFGERALLFDEPRTASVVVSSSTATLWRVDKSTIMSIMSTQMQQQLMQRICLQDTTVTLKELRHVRLIGVGAAGVVRLVSHVKTGTRYALKRIKKVKGVVPSEVSRELQLLAENDHPLLLHLVKTFETRSSVYILTELCTGGELYSAIRAIPGVLDVRQAQFYVGLLVLVLEALCDRGVLYRDLKPENVMLDAQGYLKLIDFGIAKKMPQGENRTFTLIGTPHYMAPEVARGSGYGTEVDLWSLGVIFFELVCGRLPFGDSEERPEAVVRAVAREELVFPPAYRHAPGQELIRGLLNRRPEQRLGAGIGGYEDLKAAAFFRAGFGPGGPTLFDRLMDRELDPPLLPEREVYCEAEDVEGLEDLSDQDEFAA